MPFRDLMVTWELEQAGVGDRVRLTDALASAGILTAPPLTDLEPEDLVTLRTEAVGAGEPGPAEGQGRRRRLSSRWGR